MKVISYLFVFSGIFSVSYATQSSSLEFINKDYFINTIVAQEDKTEFAKFYGTFRDRLMAMNPVDKAKSLQNIRKVACNHLEIKHPQWDSMLKPYNYFERSDKKMLNAKICSEIRSFLVRYGLYEQFLQDKAKKQASFWYQVKAYTKEMKQQVAHWAGSIRKMVWSDRIVKV